MIVQGKVHRFGDHVDTDVIIPARYLNRFDDAQLAAHCMEDMDPLFSKRVQKGDILVAGENFGCGSSREHAPRAILASGISCVIAAGFARIFYRNAINIGLPIVECAEAARQAEANDAMMVDFSTGQIQNLTRQTTYQAEPFAQFIQKIIDSGGLLNYIGRQG